MKLLPCPRCEGEDLETRHGAGSFGQNFLAVRCENCGLCSYWVPLSVSGGEPDSRLATRVAALIWNSGDFRESGWSRAETYLGRPEGPTTPPQSELTLVFELKSGTGLLVGSREDPSRWVQLSGSASYADADVLRWWPLLPREGD